VTQTSRSAPRQAGATLGLHPDGDVLGSVSGGCVEGAVVEVATEVLATGVPQRVTYGISDDEAIAVGLTCGGTIEVFVRPVTRRRSTSPSSRPHRGGRAGRRRHRDRPPGRTRRGRPRHRRRRGPRRRQRRRRRARPRDRGGGPRAAGARHHRTAPLRPARRAAHGRGHRAGRVVRSQAADARVRGDRLRQRGRVDRPLPRLPRDGLRRPGPLRDARPVPGRRRGGRRVAAPLPRRDGGRRPHRDLRADPRPEVRRARAAGRPGDRRRLHRRDGLAPHPRRPPGAPARGGRRGSGAGPVAFADRVGPRGPHAAGDGRGDRRGAGDAAPRRQRRGPAGDRRADPPRPRTATRRTHPPDRAGRPSARPRSAPGGHADGVHPRVPRPERRRHHLRDADRPGEGRAVPARGDARGGRR
jgi:hypothetical protein